MMQQTNLKDEHDMAAEWDKATALQVGQPSLKSSEAKCTTLDLNLITKNGS